MIPICTYKYALGIETFILTKKRKRQPSPGDDASTTGAASGTVGRGEQGGESAHRSVDLISGRVR